MPTQNVTGIVRNDLGTIAWEYLIGPDGQGNVGLRVLPIFTTKKKEGRYPVLPAEAFLKLQKTARAARGKYNRSDYQFGKGTYACEENGWEELLDDSERHEFGEADFESEMIATMRAMDVILRSQEVRIAAVVQDTSTMPNSSISISWNTAATAVPRSDVVGVMETMRSTYGIKPNLMTMSHQAKNDLLLTAEITDAFKYTNMIEIGSEKVQLSQLAQYFGIDEIVLTGAQKDTAKKGQSKSLSDIWTATKVGLYKVSSSRDLKNPSIGRTFLWEEDSPENVVVEQYRAEDNRSDVFRARHHSDEATIFVGAAHIMTGAR